jgi:nucleotide-binding universal stress UspA family protein
VDSPSRSYRRIILATDGSAHARAASSLLAELDWPAGVAVAVVGVCAGAPVASAGGLPPTGVGQDVERYLAMRRAEKRQEVAGLVAEAATILRERRPELAIEEIVRDGEPAAELLAQAHEWRADLIVAGARGQTVLQGLLLGSVSEALVAEGPCPVLIARETHGSLDRVLVAAGKADDAARLAEACLALPLAAGTRVLAVSVAATGGGAAADDPAYRALAETAQDWAASADAAAQAVVDRLADLLRGGGPAWTIETRLLAGDTASALLAEAVAQVVDLIVVGARERHGLAGRLGLGSVSRKLVRRASGAVLVVRGSQEDED